jgi:hypothetical protein
MVMLDIKKYDGPALTSKGLSTDQLLNVAQPHHTRHFVANIQINICDLSNMSNISQISKYGPIYHMTNITRKHPVWPTPLLCCTLGDIKR